MDCLYTVMPIQDSVDYTAAQLSQTPVVDLKSGREFKIPVTPFVLENIQARDRSARVLAGLAAAWRRFYLQFQQERVDRRVFDPVR